MSRRFGDASGFWRRSLDDRTLRNIFPDGFLPNIQSEIWDGSGAVGAKGTVSGWGWDLSALYGRNSFAFTVNNSNNVSLGPTSPTRFDAGQLRFGQFTTNLDLFRDVGTPWQRPLRVAVGAEFRRDQYGITAGEEASWKNGNAPVIGPDGVVKMRTPTDTLRGAPGAQVFPGFQPSDAGDHSRSNVGAYVDLETKLSESFLLSVAGRAERYSDFGSTLNGKVAARFDLTPGFAIRGAASTGFRAPTLGQSFFTSTATNFISGIPYDIKTLAATSDAAKVLGATPLEPESSINLSAGVAIAPVRNLSITADYYRIDIDDRIVLSGNFTQAKVQELFRNNGFPGIGGARYFTNAIDTRTNGVDVVANYGLQFANSSVLRLTAGYNRNDIEVTRVAPNPPQLVGFESTLFDRSEKARIEEGQPKDNILASANYAFRAVTINARTQRYGEVTSRGLEANGQNAFGPTDQTFGAKWITDASLAWTLRNRYTLTIGADNLFDVYPDRNVNVGDTQNFSNGGTANFGIFPYAGISPFGFNGRYVYTRLSLGL
jgi:iron complex outermembrane receptor protein